MKFTTEFYITEAPSKPTRAKLYDMRKYEIEYRAYLRTTAGEAQNWKCCYCGVRCNDDPATNPKSKRIPTLEHIKPRSDGGLDCHDNSAMACAGCNNRRGNMDLNDFIEGLASGKIVTVSTKPARLESVKRRRGRKALKKAERLNAMGWVSPTNKQLTFDDWFATLPTMDVESETFLKETYG